MLIVAPRSPITLLRASMQSLAGVDGHANWMPCPGKVVRYSTSSVVFHRRSVQRLLRLLQVSPRRCPEMRLCTGLSHQTRPVSTKCGVIKTDWLAWPGRRIPVPCRRHQRARRSRSPRTTPAPRNRARIPGRSVSFATVPWWSRADLLRRPDKLLGVGGLPLT
ncbi:hypothetical protein FKP32DRAFT_1453802 [Trametes sanguinea]|nr:hypothetical protein FKP32DRAFT_1453802 [Trametes sanguinea]